MALICLIFITSSLLVVVVSSGSPISYTVTEEAWFDVDVDDDTGNSYFAGRFTVALFGDMAPMTVMNFAALTRGYKKGKDILHYKNTQIHRIIPDFLVQMGDITSRNGTGGRSIYGARFNDEEFILSHRSAGWVSMANYGRDSNASQFFVLLTRARWLDGKHVVFGKVIRGFNVVQAIGELPTDSLTSRPRANITIVDCGLIGLANDKYDLTKSQLDSVEDIIQHGRTI